MAPGEWVHRAFVLATSLVPLAGVLWFGWSASTLLVVFWAETLLTGTANVARIALHRRLTRARGHFRLQLDDSRKQPLGRGRPTGKTTFVSEYSSILYPFTLAHGFFLGAILAGLDYAWTGEGPSPWRVDAESLRNGIFAVGGIALFELLYDAMSLGAKSFSWLKARVHVTLGRVVLLHVVVIFGAFLMMRFETPLSFLGILVGLKLVMDLGAAAILKEPPKAPPRWLAALGTRKGIDMQKEWTRMLAEAKQREEEDEEPLRVG
jgi:hypothetical protein